MTIEPLTTVFRTSDLEGRDDLPEPLAGQVVIAVTEITDCDHTPVGKLLAKLVNDESWTGKELGDAIRWNEQLGESCRSILAQSDRFRNLGNAQIEDLEIELRELKNAVLEFVRTVNVQRNMDAAFRMVEHLVAPAGEEHDCPYCECWQYKSEQRED